VAPPPLPGSTGWFVILYAGARKPLLQTLFALAAELAESFAPSLDHQVAHLRLAWWHEEVERATRGEARHPYTRALQHTALELEGLLSAAQLQLASTTLSEAAQRLPPAPFERGLFVAAAQLLHDSPLPGPLLSAVRRWAEELSAAGEPGLRSGISQRPPWPQSPALAPLAVWVTLARQRGPAPGAMAGTRWQLLKDNLRAWHAVRRAARGRFS
jgi:hypothetical protein